MRAKKYFGIILILCMAMVMSGCGTKFPEMTEEEYNHTVEYAAGLLMRYSNNGQERLIYVDAKELEKQRKKEEKEAAKEETAKTETTPIPVAPVTPVAEPDTGTDATVPEQQDGTDASAVEVTDQQPGEQEVTEVPTEEQPAQENTSASDPNAVTLSSDQSIEILQDIFLSYQGYMVTSTYPESSKSYVVNADKGKKLLVLRFDLYNGSDSSKSVNMIPLNLMFQILLNGNNLGYSSVTFLPNDLSSYSGTIDSRAHESVVVLTQIDENSASKIESLGMIATIKGVQQTVALK